MSASGLKTLICRVSLIGSLVVGAKVAPVNAAEIYACPTTLAWDPSPDPGVTGYALYYGIAGSPVMNRLDVGSVQTVTLSNLVAGSDYIFFVVACAPEGIESEPSNVLAYQPQAFSPLKLAQAIDGAIQVQFRAEPGALCMIECTESLVSPQWQLLTTATADVNGYVTISDPPTARPPQRFYRAVRF